MKTEELPITTKKADPFFEQVALTFGLKALAESIEGPEDWKLLHEELTALVNDRNRLKKQVKQLNIQLQIERAMGFFLHGQMQEVCDRESIVVARKALSVTSHHYFYTVAWVTVKENGAWDTLIPRKAGRKARRFSSHHAALLHAGKMNERLERLNPELAGKVRSIVFNQEPRG